MMPRCRFLLSILLAVCLLTSCRKDLLHWQSVQPLSAGTTHRLNRILFLNDTLGFIAGGERFTDADILTTHDGGHTWQYRTFPDAGKGLYAITSTPSGNIYVTGYEGRILHSTDYGGSWILTEPVYDAYKAMAATVNGNLIMVGGISFDYGYIRRTDTGGTDRGRDSLNYELNDIKMTGSTGYISGYGAALKTTDNGATWHRQEVGSDNFKSLCMLSTGDVWTCGYNGSIYHTTNGGESWERKRNGNDLPLPRYHLESIVFTDAQHGYAAGERGVVIYTDDGGVHWSEFDRFTGETLHSIVPAPDGSLIVCGDGGVLYRLEKK